MFKSKSSDFRSSISEVEGVLAALATHRSTLVAAQGTLDAARAASRKFAGSPVAE